MMSISKNLKYYRKKRNLTQKQLSAITGIAEITIRQYEANKYEPKNENLNKIASALQIKPIDLLGWDAPGDNYVPMQDRIEAARNLSINPIEASGIDLELVKGDPDYLNEKVQEITNRLENDIREKLENDMLDKIIIGYRQLNFNGKCKVLASIEALTKLPELRKEFTE